MKELFEKELNPQQREAVEHMDGPVLVVAGAGSGKTRVITYRMAHLISRGIPPGCILGLTFTNKAADEMKERVESMVKAAPWVSTFHSFGVRILRNEIHHLGYGNRFTIYDDTDSIRAVKQALKSLKIKEDFLSPKKAHAAISRQKNEVSLDRSLEMEFSVHQAELEAVTEAYHAILKENNAVDFDDLIVLPLRIFEDYPGVLKYYQERFRYLLVDEYQDTNAPQYKLIKMLGRLHKNVCAVGDPDQAIYRWRGSDIRNILNFENDFPGTKAIILEQNYRSTTSILDAANALIRHNRGRGRKNLWSELGKGEKVLHFFADDHEEEARQVLKLIEHLVEENEVRYRDIAVFYRTHAQSRVIEEFLRAENVPYVVIGGPGFYGRKEVKDIVAYLRVIASSQDSLSFLRIINVPRRGIGKVTLDRLAAAGREGALPLYEAAKRVDSLPTVSSSGKRAVSSFVKMIEELREKAKAAPLDKLTEELISRTGYDKMLKEEFPEDCEERMGNLEELMVAMESFQENDASAGLEDFLERISLVSDIDRWEHTENRVNLMTLHNSKGLEFEAVIIVGLEEGILPHANAMELPESLEEERRLCYVGATRAKKFLCMTAAEMRLRHGLLLESEPSRFISEIFGYADLWDEENFALLPRKKKKPPESPVTAKSAPVALKQGDRVVHPSFGRGVVTGIEEGYGEPIVQVLFDEDKEARLLSPSFAGLTKE